MDWTEKYRPSTLAEVRGNDKARDQLREWADTWPEEGRAVVLVGSPGVGKTSAAHALAADMGWDVVEVNASDRRRQEDIERLVGRAAANQTLGGGEARRQLVVVDEADSFHGNADRGGAGALTRAIKNAAQPMVLVANDKYELTDWVRRNVDTIEFRDVSSRSIVPVLRDICRQEDVAFEDEALDAIADRNSGDLRSAVKDFQAAASRTDELTVEDVVTGDRDRTRGIFEFLDDVITDATPQEALERSYDVDETPDDLIAWIEENVPKDLAGTELADAYTYLGAADRWLGRVRATQEYRYWRYATDNMTAGVAAARRGDHGGWTRYSPPGYWSKLGRSRGTRQTRDAIARRIAERGGMSMGTARREVLPFLAAMTHHCKPRDLTVAMTAAYDLDESEVAFVTGSGEDTNKVADIVATAHDGGQQPEEPDPVEVEESIDATTDEDPDDETASEAVEADDDAEATDEEGDTDAQSGLDDFF
ncbi:MAG: replication factor C large subunit [Halobacteriaceae archaeon]